MSDPAGAGEEWEGAPAPASTNAAGASSLDPEAALPWLIGKWRDDWEISCRDRMFRARGRSFDAQGHVTYTGVELGASSPRALDEELARLQRE